VLGPIGADGGVSSCRSHVGRGLLFVLGFRQRGVAGGICSRRYGLGWTR
jgi:hypothetical protein